LRSIEIIPVQYRITAAVVQCDIRLDIRVGRPAVRQPTGSAARGGLGAVDAVGSLRAVGAAMGQMRANFKSDRLLKKALYT